MADDNTAAFPRIARADLENAKNGDAWDFLFVFTEKYFELIGENEEILKEFTSSQNVLLAYNFLFDQVCNGGFIQLIVNGYGSYVFDTPFSSLLKEWGVERIAGIVDEARAVYEEHKEELEKDVTLEEFSKLYEKIKGFDPLDDRFYKVMGGETEVLKKYVEDHLEEFAVME